MKMKKTLVVLLVSSCLGFSTHSALAETNNNGSVGTITFNGKIVDTTCTVNNSKGANFTVTLPTISQTLLAAQGNTAGDTTFSLELTGCTGTNGLSALAYFYNDDHVTDNGRLENQASGGKAQNVTIQLADFDGTAIDVTKDAHQTSGQKSTAYPFGQNDRLSLKYKARYYAESTGVTAGDVTAKVQYVIAYQ